MIQSSKFEKAGHILYKTHDRRKNGVNDMPDKKKFKSEHIESRSEPEWYAHNDDLAEGTRYTSKAYVEYGWHKFGINSNYYVGKTTAEFIPPITGYYSMVKVNDDSQS